MGFCRSRYFRQSVFVSLALCGVSRVCARVRRGQKSGLKADHHHHDNDHDHQSGWTRRAAWRSAVFTRVLWKRQPNKLNAHYFFTLSPPDDSADAGFLPWPQWRILAKRIMFDHEVCLTTMTPGRDCWCCCTVAALYSTKDSDRVVVRASGISWGSDGDVVTVTDAPTVESSPNMWSPSRCLIASTMVSKFCREVLLTE